MSILFNKLRALSAPAKTLQPAAGSGLKRKGNIYTFRRFVFSPAGALLILGMIVVFGFFSYYSLIFLQNYIDKKKIAAIVENNSPAADTSPEPASSDLLEPGGSSGFSDLDTAPAPPSPEGLPDPVSNPPEMPARAEYIKARPGRLYLPERIRHSPDQAVPPSAPSRQNRSAGGLESTAPAVAVVSEKPDGPAENRTANRSTAPVYAPPAAGPDTAFPADTRRTEETGTSEGSRPEKPLVQVLNQNPGDIRKNKERILKQGLKAQTAKITALTKKIETAIRAGNYREADELIDDLSELTDNSGVYFLKLRAFMDINRQDYESAYRLLEKVIRIRPDDSEAQLNMAVIEIREKRYGPAKTRLLRLREIYPSDRRIQDMIDRL